MSEWNFQFWFIVRTEPQPKPTHRYIMYTLSNKTCIFVDRSEKKKKITVWCDIPNTSFGVYKKGFEMTHAHCKNDS